MCTRTNGPTDAIIDVESGVARPTGFHFQCQGWSPDGTRLLCADYDAIYTLNPDGTDQVPVAPLGGGGVGWMVWLRAEEE
jgi:hypothetical protein